MKRRKTDELEKVLFAVLKGGKITEKVKPWQYYSVLEFCRWFEESKQKCEEAAKWCMDRARIAGDVYKADGYSITIVEEEVPV